MVMVQTLVAAAFKNCYRQGEAALLFSYQHSCPVTSYTTDNMLGSVLVPQKNGRQCANLLEDAGLSSFSHHLGQQHSRQV